MNNLPLLISPPQGSRRRRHPRLPQPGGVPWSTWQVLIVLALFALIQVPAGILLEVSLAGAGLSKAAMLSILLVSVVAVSHAAGWLMAWLLVARWHGQRFAAALGFKAWPPARLAATFGAAIAVYGIAMVPAYFWQPPSERTNVILEFFRAGGPHLLLLLAVAVIFAPLMEEVLFRGLLQPALRRRWSFPAAALLTTLLFTALHFTQTGMYWPSVAGIFLCGACLAWLRERTGSLWPPIAFHMGFNSTPFLVWLANLPLGGMQ